MKMRDIMPEQVRQWITWMLSRAVALHWSERRHRRRRLAIRVERAGLGWSPALKIP
jgi:hypothetical protein